VRRVLPHGLRGEIVAAILAASLISVVAYVGADALLSSTAAAHAVGLAVMLVAVVAAALWCAARLGRRLSALTAAARALADGRTPESLSPTGDAALDGTGTAISQASARTRQMLPDLTMRLQSLACRLAEETTVGEWLSGHDDLSERLQGLTCLIRDAFSAHVAGLFVRDDDNDVLAFVPSGTLTRQRLGLRAAAERAMSVGLPLVLDANHFGGLDCVDGYQTERLACCLAAPLLSGSRVLGAVVVGDREPDRFDDSDLLMLTAAAAQVTMAMRNAEVIDRLRSTSLATIRALAAAMESKDQYTAEHAESLALTAVAVGQHLGLGSDDLCRLEYASLLHDIGKIGVPGAILNKADQLTDAEYAEITKHTILGERISSQVDDLKPVAGIIRSAHERWDGAGYPDGLAGEKIPLLSRILLVCDAFDAMTSTRPYRDALPVEAALVEVRACAGGQFDPDVVDALIAVWEKVGRLRGGGTPEMPIYVWHTPRRDPAQAQTTAVM
jgi:HD-GYP domain-containing protein (c-di-GMP phosphodiesterase class II)